MSDVLPPDEQFYTTKQAAELFQVTPETIQNWIKKGVIDVLPRPDNRGPFRIRRTSLVRFANSKYMN